MCVRYRSTEASLLLVVRTLSSKMQYSVSVCALSLLLFIELPLSLTETPSYNVITVPLKSSLSLPCLRGSAPALSEAKVSWMFTPLSSPGSAPVVLETPRFNSRDSFHNDTRLSIERVEDKNAGQYKCVVIGWMDERLVKLRNSYSVQVVHDSKLDLLEVVEGVVGGTVTLPCSSTYPPGPGSGLQADWFFGTGSSRKKLSPKQAEEGEWKDDGRVQWASPTNWMGDWSIKISNVTMEDSGEYSCEWSGGPTFEDHLRSHKVELHINLPPTPPPSKCLGYDTPWEECTAGISQASGRAILQESLADFSFKVYSHLSQLERSKNMLFSPISISWMLTHLLLGARGDTRTDLEKALFLPHKFACLHKEMKDLREDLRDSVEIASNMFHSHEFTLNEIFINQSQLFYGAVPQKLTNDSEQNVKMINQWVAENTNNRITDMVDSVSPNVLLMLLNTVYFNGKWKMMFGKKTMNAPFVKLSGDMVQVPVLHSDKYKLAQRYNQHIKAQVAVFPLSGKTVLYILLPETASSEALEQLEEKLNEQNVKAMVKEMEKAPVETTEVTLPKISLSTRTDLMDILETLGLAHLMSEPNLCGLAPPDRPEALSLSDGQHRAFLSLTEKGVEAGAVTSISFSRSFSSFSALRPFVLLLWNEQLNGPLFLGRVTDP
ncbi:hypothetical protein GJAV_G00065920 [Gymnothorax javanicus]|nr:hypothetical protein GJAV_G00065920 [Gymnothorax javanicus]